MYKDIPFSLKIANNTDIEMLEYHNAVNQSVKNIILTNKGELHYFPQFGCGVKKYLFEKMNFFTYLMIKDEIKTALENFEPRISDIQVEVIGKEDVNQLIIDLSYKINSIDIKSSQQINLGIV